MSDGVQVNETDLEIARTGIMVQVEAQGLSELFETNEGFRAFVENQIQVKAADIAYIAMQSSVINKGAV